MKIPHISTIVFFFFFLISSGCSAEIKSYFFYKNQYLSAFDNHGLIT